MAAPLSLEERFRFLLAAYFGEARPNQVQPCVRRAYRDTARTLHGIGDVPDAEGLKQRAHEVIEQEIRRAVAEVNGREAFDEWHEAVCNQLIALFRDAGYDRFCLGQAQKWVNMAVKYVFVVRPECLRSFDHLHEHCHVPIDNRIQDLWAHDISQVEGAWSKLSSPREYMRFQRAAREAWDSPLSEEFTAWTRSFGW